MPRDHCSRCAEGRGFFPSGPNFQHRIATRVQLLCACPTYASGEPHHKFAVLDAFETDKASTQFLKPIVSAKFPSAKFPQGRLADNSAARTGGNSSCTLPTVKPINPTTGPLLVSSIRPSLLPAASTHGIDDFPLRPIATDIQ